MNDQPHLHVRALPARPILDQIKRQAKELLSAFRAGDPAATAEVQVQYRGADSKTFALHHAQLVLARVYGFDSWPKLKAFVDRGSRRIPTIRPVELQSARGGDVWNTIVAASAGDTATLQRLLERDPRLARADYWYSPVLHFAVREGHMEAAQLLLDAGADPESNGLNDKNLIEMARERGDTQIVALLERVRDQRGRVPSQSVDHPIHHAAARGDIATLCSLLDANPLLANLGSSRGMTPLHYAVLGGHQQAVIVLLDRGANIDTRNTRDLQAIDLAVLDDHSERNNIGIARLLLSRGATCDLTIASAVGDVAIVRQMLAADPARIREARPSGRRPLSAAVQFNHSDIAMLLLDCGADPLWDEPDAPHGRSLHWASRLGNLAMVRLLLDHGADPNESIDSTSSPATFAATPEIRALIESHGGDSGMYDPTWVEDDDLLKNIAAHPSKHVERIGAAFVMSADRSDLLARLLGAGIRMPAIHTSCQGYLLNPDALRTLLAHGMTPDQMNWQHQTLLHLASAKDDRACAAILLDAGATLTARDDEYRSTPLAWAARANKPLMVEFLLSRGAPVELPDDESWATPMAWAERRGHCEVVSILRAHGVTR